MIVYPTNQSLQRVGAVLVLVGIWTLSCLLAAPLFIWRTLKHHDLDFPAIGLTSVEFCLEEWPTDHGRAYYSIFTIIFQYFVPVTIISFAYMGTSIYSFSSTFKFWRWYWRKWHPKLRLEVPDRDSLIGNCHEPPLNPLIYPEVKKDLISSIGICKKLRYRMRPGTTSNANVQGSAGCSDRDTRRVRRTNVLLISIAVIFGISWMPLNVLNVVADLDFPFKGHRETYFIIYAMW